MTLIMFFFDGSHNNYFNSTLPLNINKVIWRIKFSLKENDFNINLSYCL